MLPPCPLIRPLNCFGWLTRHKKRCGNYTLACPTIRGSCIAQQVRTSKHRTHMDMLSTLARMHKDGLVNIPHEHLPFAMFKDLLKFARFRIDPNKASNKRLFNMSWPSRSVRPCPGQCFIELWESGAKIKRIFETAKDFFLFLFFYLGIVSQQGLISLTDGSFVSVYK